MKKLLLFLSICIIESHAFAQAVAALTVRNNNQNCTLYFSMHAIETASGNSSPCDIYSNLATLAPATTIAYTDPSNFNALVGYSSMTFSMSASAIASTTTWQWTDVTFQWNCPSPCIGSGGGNMSDGWSTANGYSCYGPPSTTSWGGVLGTCTAVADTWNAVPATGPMSNITLNFN